MKDEGLVNELYDLFDQLIPKQTIRKGVKLCKKQFKSEIGSTSGCSVAKSRGYATLRIKHG